MTATWRSEPVRALGESLRQILLSLVKTLAGEQGEAAEEALSVLRETLGEEEVFRLLRRLPGVDGDLRLRALYVFGCLAHSRQVSLEAFGSILRFDPEGEWRGKVVAQLVDLPFSPPQVLPLLLFALKDPDEAVSNTALHGIQRMYPKVPRDVLRLFRAEDLQVRLSAVENLVKIQPDLLGLKDSLILKLETKEFPALSGGRLDIGKEADVEASNPAQSATTTATESRPGALGSVGNGPGEWAPRCWTNIRQVALRFASEEELDRAIDGLWTAPELRGLPRVHVGQNAMVVPAEAVELFRQKGYRFTACTVVSAGDLPPEEVNRIRRQG